MYSLTSIKKRGFTLIELLVVMVIASMIVTFASVAYFNANKKEGQTKAKRQMRDIILMARQRACTSGQPQAIVFWNDQEKIAVGKSVSTRTLPRYALFSYLGDVYINGKNIIVPFRGQSTLLKSLRAVYQKNSWEQSWSPAINLNDPKGTKTFKIKRFARTIGDTTERVTASYYEPINFSYKIEGDGVNLAMKNFRGLKIGETEQAPNVPSGTAIPLAIQASQIFLFPKTITYASNTTSFREVVVFDANGTLASAPVTLTLRGNNVTIKVAFKKDGSVDISDTSSAQDQTE